MSTPSVIASGQIIKVRVGSCDVSLQCVFGEPIHEVVLGTCEDDSIVLCRVPNFNPALLSRTKGPLYPIVAVRSTTYAFDVDF